MGACASSAKYRSEEEALDAGKTQAEINNWKEQQSPSVDDTVAQVEVLINLRDSTGYEGWTKNKEGWDKLKAGMSGKQAEAIGPKGVKFDAEGRPTEINLQESGLSGECPRFSSRHQSLIAHGNTHTFLAGPLPDMSPLTHLDWFIVSGNKCTGATMQIV